MAKPDAAPIFPETIVFPDVDAETLAREDWSPRRRKPERPVDSWSEYLRKVLPPLQRSNKRESLLSFSF